MTAFFGVTRGRLAAGRPVVAGFRTGGRRPAGPAGPDGAVGPDGAAGGVGASGGAEGPPGAAGAPAGAAGGATGTAGASADGPGLATSLSPTGRPARGPASGGATDGDRATVGDPLIGAPGGIWLIGGCAVKDQPPCVIAPVSGPADGCPTAGGSESAPAPATPSACGPAP